MPDWSEDEMDRLFQEGAEQSGFEYKPEAWEQMSRLLDQDRRRRALWWWAGGLGLALLAGFILFHFGENLNAPVEKTKQQQNAVVSQPQPVESQPQKTAVAAVKPEELPGQADNTEKNRTGQAHSKPSFFDKTKTTGRKNALNKMAGKPDSETNEPPTGRAGGAFSEKTATPTDTAAGVSKPAIEKSHETAGENLEDLPALPVRVIPKPVSLMLVNNAALEAALQKMDRPKPANLFVIGAVAASELSSIGMGDFSRGSWKAGLHFEYRYAGRYGLSACLNYMRMRYLAEKGEFNPTKDFWVDKTEPESTDGTCDVLEMPVALSFYSNGQTRSGLFASVGMNSLFMQREYYYYEYYPYDPSLPEEWETGKNSRFWFGIGTASVGYFKKLSGKTALLIAPYVQFPLAGIGSGNVRLFSIGTSVRYEFQFH